MDAPMSRKRPSSPEKVDEAPKAAKSRPNRWRLRPAPDARRPGRILAIRDPRRPLLDVRGIHLPAEGAEVVPDTYWLRRLRDGDVFRSDEG